MHSAEAVSKRSCSAESIWRNQPEVLVACENGGKEIPVSERAVSTLMHLGEENAEDRSVTWTKGNNAGRRHNMSSWDEGKHASQSCCT